MNISAPNRISYLRTSVFLPDGRRSQGSPLPSPAFPKRQAAVFFPVDYTDYKTKCEKDRECKEEDTRSVIVELAEPVNSGILNRFKRMATIYPYRDVSWLVVVMFTIATTAFVVNGFLGLLPLVFPTTLFPSFAVASPASILTGSILFSLGGFLGLLSAFNVDRSSLSKDTKSDDQLDFPLYKPALLGSSEFVWFPSASEFKSIYLPSIAFRAGLIQFVGGIIFSIAGFAGFPGVISVEDPLAFAYTQALVFLPQLIGGFLFLCANLVLMIMAQERWYKPNFGEATWNIAFLSAMGSIGFMLTGGLLLIDPTMGFLIGASSFWGAWSLFLGILVQWYVLMGFYPDK
ncbi:hypothetical protein BKA61DRAFT_686000 [Leptodontidium sp. MPI-SDFR-AT-0119]|nr:hypothetical protein BKA61DRAFT_686000 [Leptodontidium sp. MPI-SDFR-AT-0119]